MTEISPISIEDKFLFDVQGFMHLKQVLTSGQCQEFLQVLKRLKENEYADEWREAVPPELREKCNPTCDRRHRRVRFNGLSRLDPVFDALIAQPRVMSYLKDFVADPLFFVNGWSIEKNRDSVDVGWHRAISPSDYSCRDGKVRSRVLNTMYLLTDNGPEDGCAVAVPGSHKNNIDLKWSDYQNLDMPGSRAMTGQAGDVFIFSEALLHGGLPKTTGGLRTNLYFNYAEAIAANAVMADPKNGHHYWMPPSVRARFTPEQKAATRWMEWTHAFGESA